MKGTENTQRKGRQASQAHAGGAKATPRAGQDASQPENAQRTRAPRPATGAWPKGDRAAALAVLASVGVVPGTSYGDRMLARLAAFYQGIAATLAEWKARENREQRDYQTLARVLSGARLLTEAGQRLRDCFIRDLQGKTLTISEVQRGETRPPILKPLEKGKAGRPNDLAIERTMRDFADVHGWSWEVCAAAVFTSGADKRSYTAIKKSFRDVATKLGRR